MNRLFVLQVGPRILRGLISPSELPDVVLTFYRTAEQHGAIPSYHAGGVFLAVKGEVQVRLTIGQYHIAMPSRLLADVLTEVMSQAFDEIGPKTDSSV